jgi:hypothetical protein
MLNRYVELYSPEGQQSSLLEANLDELENLERQSKLVKRIKPMLTQRSYSIERLSIINVQNFTSEEKEKITQIMDIQEEKIKTFL